MPSYKLTPEADGDLEDIFAYDVMSINYVHSNSQAFDGYA